MADMQMQMSSQYRAEILETQRLKQDKKKGSGDQRGKPVTSLALSLSLFLSLAPRSTALALLARSPTPTRAPMATRTVARKPTARRAMCAQYTVYKIHCTSGTNQWQIQKRFKDVRSYSCFAHPHETDLHSNANPGGACVGVP